MFPRFSEPRPDSVFFPFSEVSRLDFLRRGSILLDTVNSDGTRVNRVRITDCRATVSRNEAASQIPDPFKVPPAEAGIAPETQDGERITDSRFGRHIGASRRIVRIVRRVHVSRHR